LLLCAIHSRWAAPLPVAQVVELAKAYVDKSLDGLAMH
jgi:hypothetical protein